MDKENGKVLVFCRTKRGVDNLQRQLHQRHRVLNAFAIHGDKTQQQRDYTLQQFRSGACRVLIATDVVARGLDVSDVTAVVNFDFPNQIEDYVHRIGRTGRAGRKGVAYTLVTNEDVGKSRALINVIQEAGQEVPSDLIELSRNSYSFTAKRRSLQPWKPDPRNFNNPSQSKPSSSSSYSHSQNGYRSKPVDNSRDSRRKKSRSPSRERRSARRSRSPDRRRDKSHRERSVDRDGGRRTANSRSGEDEETARLVKELEQLKLQQMAKMHAAPGMGGLYPPPSQVYYPNGYYQPPSRGGMGGVGGGYPPQSRYPSDPRYSAQPPQHAQNSRYPPASSPYQQQQRYGGVSPSHYNPQQQQQQPPPSQNMRYGGASIPLPSSSSSYYDPYRQPVPPSSQRPYSSQQPSPYSQFSPYSQQPPSLPQGQSPEWECPSCTYLNKREHMACSMCGGAQRSGMYPPSSAGGVPPQSYHIPPPSASPQNPRAVRKCSACGLDSSGEHETCLYCRTPFGNVNSAPPPQQQQRAPAGGLYQSRE